MADDDALAPQPRVLHELSIDAQRVSAAASRARAITLGIGGLAVVLGALALGGSSLAALWIPAGIAGLFAIVAAGMWRSAASAGDGMIVAQVRSDGLWLHPDVLVPYDDVTLVRVTEPGDSQLGHGRSVSPPGAADVDLTLLPAVSLAPYDAGSARVRWRSLVASGAAVWVDAPEPALYVAFAVGDEWQFDQFVGVLAEQLLGRGIMLYRSVD